MAADKGVGPPPGSSSDYKGAPKIPLADLARMSGQGTAATAPGGAFAPPSDPLTAPGVADRFKIVYRDVPNVTIQNTWAVDEIRAALYAHMIGQFDLSGQLCDSILGDDRVIATLGSRTSALFGREVKHVPADDSDAAKEVCQAWADHWPKMSADASMPLLADYSVLMGFAPSQLVWNTTKPIWKPFFRPWPNRFTYFDWDSRRLIALAQDGSIPITPGDAKWFVHAPFGIDRGWIRGALRAVAEPWALRHFGFRDMGSFSDVHGQPTRVAETPAVADPVQRAQFEEQIANMGSNATILLSKGVDESNSYGYRLVEASDTAWECSPGLIDRCDMAIVLAILFQNLTTEVTGGSFAATSAHMDVRQGGTQFDGKAWTNSIYTQVARPFAFINFGDADLAPTTLWDVAPRADYDYNSKQFQAFGTAVEVLRRGGIEFQDVNELREFAAKRFGLADMPAFKITEPVASGSGGG